MHSGGNIYVILHSIQRDNNQYNNNNIVIIIIAIAVVLFFAFIFNFASFCFYLFITEKNANQCMHNLFLY